MLNYFGSYHLVDVKEKVTCRDRGKNLFFFHPIHVNVYRHNEKFKTVG